VTAAAPAVEPAARPVDGEPVDLHASCADLREQVNALEQRLRKSDDRRRAMLHILSDYESDRRELARQTERLRNNRRALLHILQDSHHSNLSLERSRKALIHIMGDLHETGLEMQRRELELREKQEQLVQAAKLATLGELTTGVAHELNNPLNNIGLFMGNVIDLVNLGQVEKEPILRDLNRAMRQVHKATEIISHLRTFGRAAPVSRERVSVNGVVRQAMSLIQEQLRLREIEVELDLAAEDPAVLGNAIQLEQVFMNLLTNARDAVAESKSPSIRISSRVEAGTVELVFADTGPGIPPGLEQRIFDPFFTTKEVGAGTGLGLSITYGIIQDHEGEITVDNRPGEGVEFLIELPLATEDRAVEAAE
jgi:C4-dicarboxylate-specific signal transduction histidine kinase